MLIKYSEYPVYLIYELFCNGVHTETIISKDKYLEKLNKK